MNFIQITSHLLENHAQGLKNWASLYLADTLAPIDWWSVATPRATMGVKLLMGQ